MPNIQNSRSVNPVIKMANEIYVEKPEKRHGQYANKCSMLRTYWKKLVSFGNAQNLQKRGWMFQVRSWCVRWCCDPSRNLWTLLYAFEVVELAGFKTQSNQDTFGYLRSSAIISINTYNYVVKPLEFTFSALTRFAMLTTYLQMLRSLGTDFSDLLVHKQTFNQMDVSRLFFVASLEWRIPS